MKATAMILLITMLGTTSCMKLDAFLYTPNSDIDAYYLDDFDGQTEIDIDQGYDLPDSMIHIFTISSGKSGDEYSIYAVYVGNISTIASDTVILYLHGNTGNLDYYWPRVALLANAGHKNRFGVMAIDYRGYGLSEGTPSEEGLYEDTDAAMLWLKNNGLTSDRLVIYGFSLGSAPATKLTADARSLQPSKLMLESCFASDEVMVQDGSGLSLPGNYFSSLEIDNARKIAEVEEAFFWIHGTDDNYLSMETHGEVVYKNYRGSYSEAHRVEGAVHNDVPVVMGTETYLEAVTEFITR